jgi:hypothetical protein
MASRILRAALVLALSVPYLALLPSLGSAWAQTAGGRLVITATDASSMPAVTLQARGVAADGTPLDLSTQSLVVTHAGEIISDVNVIRPVDTGTFAVFLLDVTGGVAAQIPTLQDTILRYASSAYMREGIDYVSIFRVGAADAQQVLEPTQFHNSVRNYFATPLQPESGATALYDSAVDLLDDMAGLLPDPALAPAVVIVSDGTDAVSTQAQAGDIAARARELGIPVHTIWLLNEELTVGQEAGRNYLAEVAADATGAAARLDQPETADAIFERLTLWGRQYLLQYTVPDPQPGTHTVFLSLEDTPSIQAETTVTIEAAMPVVNLNVPAESRNLTLPDLSQPVSLGFSAEVGWLDGVERSLQQAQLQVNGQPVADVPPANLGRFTADVPNLVFGGNTLQLVVLDEQGLRGASPVITLDVNQGAAQIPPELQPSSAFLTNLAPLCLGGLLLLAIFGLGGFFAYRSGRLRLPQRARRGSTPVTVEEMPAAPGVQPYAPVEEPYPVAGAMIPGQIAYLEVVSAETPIASPIAISQEETRLGRSPNLSDIALTQDLTVSRLHATITWDGQVYRIYDEESTSGSWVNDQQVPDYGTQLIDGDEIYLGKVHLRFRHR